MKKDEIANTLEEYAEFLEIDGQTGRAHAYRKAANAINRRRFIPPNPAKINGIGDSTRSTVIDLDNGNQIDELEQLRETYDWYDAFKDVKYIGPSRAEQIHQTFNVSSLEKLDLVAANGDLTMISGIGPSTASKIQKSIVEIRDSNSRLNNSTI